MPETTNSILRVGEGSPVLGIRVGVPNLTKFDVKGVRRWRRFDIRGWINALCVQEDRCPWLFMPPVPLLVNISCGSYATGMDTCLL